MTEMVFKNMFRYIMCIILLTENVIGSPGDPKASSANQIGTKDQTETTVVKNQTSDGVQQVETVKRQDGETINMTAVKAVVVLLPANQGTLLVFDVSFFNSYP